MAMWDDAIAVERPTRQLGGRTSATEAAPPPRTPMRLEQDALTIRRARDTRAPTIEAGGGRIRRSAVARSAIVIRRKIVADGEPGAGLREVPERTSLDGLLRHNSFDPLAFSTADYDALGRSFDKIAPLEESVGKTKANKKIQAKAKVKAAYDALMQQIGRTCLRPGHRDFDDGVAAAVEQYDGLDEKKNTDKAYQDVAATVWPHTPGRGAMPESFWKEVKRQIRTAHAQQAAAGGYSTECNDVFSDMNDQFDRWNGTLTTRGAWWGSQRPGDTGGARSVPVRVSLELQRRAAQTNWRMQNSDSGGVSFHRTRGGVDFIYHMRPP